ncbi:polar amino acid transport system substrate-binding protein [Brevinema andersonii]|uniref:Polar amino acid transport system substrate-binding protein n=1 Tax=Brevinema andersonii TaxID=34097 RepID=A0A1I1EQ28_BREAD|nr:basic amino acid ABC transporter substrate-binding protein [Brevinema andersonii]SFB89097.1 polar amino acid transport system substrate-binding protein [Brevinema andersonii]
MKNMKWLWMLCIMVAGCGLKKQDILYVGTDAEFPPFEYIDQDKIVGFDIDLINEIAKFIKKDIKIMNISFDGLIPALQSKKVDLIISGMTITEDRRKSVAFSQVYYTSREQMIILNKTTTDINTLEDLQNKKVGVVLGFTGDILISEMKYVNVERFNNVSSAILALQAQKVDALVIDFETAHNYVSVHSDLKLVATSSTQEDYAIALRLQDQELLEKINEAITKLKDHGTIGTLYKKYLTE